MTLRTLNYGNYGIFLIMGNAGFCPSTVVGRDFGKIHCSDLCGALTKSKRERRKLLGLQPDRAWGVWSRISGSPSLST